MLWNGGPDDARELALREPVAQCRLGALGRQSSPPPCWIQFIVHLELVWTGPILLIHEAQFADPGAGDPVDGGPGTQSLFVPTAQDPPLNLGGFLPREDLSVQAKIASLWWLLRISVPNKKS